MAKLIGTNKINVAVFISGTGSNFKNLIIHSLKKKSKFKIALVISNNSLAKGLNYANKFKIKKKVINYSNIINAENINEKSVQYMYQEWDSLAYLSIAMEVEKQFSLEIDENNFNEFGSVKQIVEIIKNNAK